MLKKTKKKFGISCLPKSLGSSGFTMIELVSSSVFQMYVPKPPSTSNKISPPRHALVSFGKEISGDNTAVISILNANK